MKALQRSGDDWTDPMLQVWCPPFDQTTCFSFGQAGHGHARVNTAPVHYAGAVDIGRNAAGS
jgi:hypothetical protein